jgi:thiol-disulfide isomerase/thioredoxin|eukprot:TRINITY_DN42181_c0_g1_i1.p2 TRINITY_DN42181_c0_g1~~TRINITY_DN42181_c0_g1_i1.p2  ORF type:complete len:284 (+),score=48.15 TRINITY_DN42181_c0_g1_i1:30-881(+)
MRFNVLLVALMILSVLGMVMGMDKADSFADEEMDMDADLDLADNADVPANDGLAHFTSPASRVFENRDALANAMKGKASVVAFFNAKCPKCKGFEQDWLNTARKIKGLQFLAMDAQKNPLLPPGFEFRYFPSIWYVDKKGSKWRYTDSLSEAALTEFVNHALKTPTFSLLEQGEAFDLDAHLDNEAVHEECVYHSLAETAATADADADAEEETDSEAEVEAEGASLIDMEADADAETEVDSEADAEDADYAEINALEADYSAHGALSAEDLQGLESAFVEVMQ